MFNKNKRILRHASSDESFPDVAPAKIFIPEWYKKTDRFKSGVKTPNRLPFENTFKVCTVFSDAFISGYVIPLPVDLAVEQTPEGPMVTWSPYKDERFVELRDQESNKNLPTPNGFSSRHFIWLTKHVLKIPKGYSALLTHPLNRYDLPFITLSGIVDGELALYGGNVPMFLSNTFEGIIPAGTPVVQVLLFKTENWTSKKDLEILKESKINEAKSINKSIGWYKQNIWKKKQYD